MLLFNFSKVLLYSMISYFRAIVQRVFLHVHLACRDGTLEAIFFSRRQIGQQQRADNFGGSFWSFAIFSGCSAPILMSARQNTYRYIADRMVLARGPGKFCVNRSGRLKVGFHGRIFGRFF